MATANDSMFDTSDQTVPDEIAALDVEVQAMFERVRTRLGLQPARRMMLGRYELRRWIGNGGMGEVYCAYDSELEREVAIKLVSPRPLSDLKKLRERLRREAKVLAKLEHANVVTIYDAGVESGRGFLVMALVAGVTLRERQAREGCSLRERLRLYIEAGRGLVAAHERGIVHRDFKPDNVFVGEDDHARVGDFGLAYVIGDPQPPTPGEGALTDASPTRVTRTGEVLGTVGYMAPEQLRGDQPDARSDQYAYCVSLWEGVTGVRPFDGANAKALLLAMEGEPRGGQWMPRGLRRALRVGLAPRPEDRHSSMAALVAVLERELARPKRLAVTGAFCLLIVVAVAGLVLGWSGYRAAHPDCALAERIAALPARPEWSLLDEYALRGTAARLEDAVQRLEADAREFCISQDVALGQKVRMLHAHLESTLDQLPDYSPEQIERFVVDYENAAAARSSQPISVEVVDYIESTITPLETAWALGEVVARIGDALNTISQTSVDRAELLLRRGRANSLLGDYDAALADFKQARRYATGMDGDRHLQASLGAAKTTVMRLEQLQVGEELLDLVEDELWALREPVFSSRRTDFLELSATLARHNGHLDAALEMQRRVVLRHALASSTYELVAALVNLGNIHSDRGDVSSAERCYRLALSWNAVDPEAALGLGRLLVNEDSRPDEARKLLGQVSESREHDLHVAAAISRLELEVYAQEPVELTMCRVKLVHLLRSSSPRTPTHEREGWTFVALALSREKEFGSSLEDALARLPEPQTEADMILRAQLELSIANSAASGHHDVAKRFLNLAQVRLVLLPPSTNTTSLLSHARDLQRELEPSVDL